MTPAAAVDLPDAVAAESAELMHQSYHYSLLAEAVD